MQQQQQQQHFNVANQVLQALIFQHSQDYDTLKGSDPAVQSCVS